MSVCTHGFVFVNMRVYRCWVVFKMPGQFLDAPSYKMTLTDFKDGSYFIRELRRRGVFKSGVVKLQLPEEVCAELENKLTELGDMESENSVYKSTLSGLSVPTYMRQSVNVVDKEESVFEVDHVAVASSLSGVATLGDFYNFAKRERDFGTYKGIVKPANGIYDAESVKKISKAFWKVCGRGQTKEKPFLYGVDIGLPPSARLGAYADLDLFTVNFL